MFDNKPKNKVFSFVQNGVKTLTLDRIKGVRNQLRFKPATN